jgi:hypothetical protein
MKTGQPRITNRVLLTRMSPTEVRRNPGSAGLTHAGVMVAMLLASGTVLGQSRANLPAAMVGSWITQTNPAMARLDLRADGWFSFTRQVAGQSRTNTGAYAVSGDTIHLNPGSADALRLRYVWLGPKTLQLSQADGAVFILTRRPSPPGTPRVVSTTGEPKLAQPKGGLAVPSGSKAALIQTNPPAAPARPLNLRIVGGGQ